jgi:L-alanine-DL-glutamate epimerase-like enolase superfamily enzyme
MNRREWLGCALLFSAPSRLRITDMRACRVAAAPDYPIIKLYTNQGVCGLGEVRDGGAASAALILKARLLGRNPLEIASILRSIRAWAGPGRMGGGYSAVDVALHDIAGKVHGVPVWRLLGGEARGRVPVRCGAGGDPNLLSAGGLRETRRLLHHSARRAVYCGASPVGTLAAVHLAAAMDGVVVMEPQAFETPWWQDLVTGVPQPILRNGYIEVPDAPGLGVELNDEVVRRHLRQPGYFGPTGQFDEFVEA